jgi:O-antigen/teichoic acid export membrane protein
LVIRKFGTNSAELVQYYYWIFPFGLGLTIYSVLEAYAWQLKRSVLTNYLRELQFRIFTTVLIVLFLVGVIKNFDVFIKFYSLTYFLIAAILFFLLWQRRELFITFNISRVSKKFFKKIVTLAAFVWSGNLIYNVANVFDTIILAAVLPNGLAFAGIFTLAQNIASLVQAPQRGIISASVAPLAQAWKDKDIIRIRRIYQRSSINMLVFSIGMFALITLNFIDGVETFQLKSTYVQALPVFLFIGLMRILDMGTGLNSQIIGTSTFWRFEFFTGIALLAMALPLNYYLTKSLGVIGPAISNLIAFTIYNAIRCVFLYQKFKMQPFTIKSLYTIVLGGVAYILTYYLFDDKQGFLWICIRSVLFIVVYTTGVIMLKLTPDVEAVLIGLRDRLYRRKPKD